MSAATTDKFTKVGTPGTATTLASPGYTQGDTSITVGSTTNWPTDYKVYFAIDRAQVTNGVEERITGTYCEFSGIVTGATTIGSLTKEYGTAQDYAAGSLTRVYIPVSSGRENALVDGLVVEHNPDGTHATALITARTEDTSPASSDYLLTYDVSATALKKVKPSNLLNLAGLWSTWTPTWTNLTAGNGTVVARYTQIGKTIHYHLQFTWGSTTSLSTGDTYFTLPATAHSSYNKQYSVVIGQGTGWRGTTGYPLSVGIGSSTANAVLQSIGTNGGTSSVFAVQKSYSSASSQPTSGFTTGDIIELSGTYEAA